MNRNSVCVLPLRIVGGGLLLASAASAQNLGQQQGIAVGEAELFPSIRIDYQLDSNVSALSEDEIDGQAVVVQPRFDYLADRRGLVFSGSYAGAYSLGTESELDSVDHRLALGLSAEFDSRRRSDLRLSVNRLHQEVGFGLTRGLGDQVDEPLVFNDLGLLASFTYGARDARGNLTGGFRLQSRSYTNLNSISDGLSFNSFEPFARFGVRVGGDSRAFVEVRATTVSFDDSDRDRDEIGALVGLQFSASGRLSGSIGLGVENVDFSAQSADDATVFVVESSLRYQPRSFAELSLDVSREVNNAGVGAVASGDRQAIETAFRLGWNHSWSSRVTSSAFVETVIQDEICPSFSDTVSSAGLEFNVSVRRWLQLGASASGTSRSVDQCAPDDGSGQLEFERQIIGAHVRATL